MEPINMWQTFFCIIILIYILTYDTPRHPHSPSSVCPVTLIHFVHSDLDLLLAKISQHNRLTIENIKWHLHKSEKDKYMYRGISHKTHFYLAQSIKYFVEERQD